jgi:hypothetical protein
MFLLRLTADNRHSFKRHLRDLYPQIGSSHLTEALSAGFGWNTHAAFKTALNSVPLGREPAVRFDIAAMQTRLGQLSADRIDGARVADCLRALPDPCWREFPRRDRPAEDDWFYACERASIPFIYVRVARKYALLQWDCISINPKYEAAVREVSARAMVEQLFARFQKRAKGSPGRPLFEGSAFVGTVENLLPNVARLLADDFFEMLYGATRIASPEAEAA